MAHKTHALPIGIQKIRFSWREHVLPPLLGLGACLAIYGLLNFQSLLAQAQYYTNQIRLATPAHSAVVASQKSSEILIPSIKVRAPVVYEQSTNSANFEYALRSGTVHYATTALPGEKGNVVIFGHSSGLTWAPGNYKFVFTLLDKVKQGQQISVYYHGVQYVYVVTGSQVVSPTNMSVLESHSGRSELSLITCTPVGTSENRLVVHAQQVRPDPANNKPFQPTSRSSNSLPGN